MYIPRPPNVPLLRAFWSLLDGIWGVLKSCWGVLVHTHIDICVDMYGVGSLGHVSVGARGLPPWPLRPRAAGRPRLSSSPEAPSTQNRYYSGVSIKGSYRAPLKGARDIDVDIDVDTEVDVDINLAVSINWGVL